MKSPVRSCFVIIAIWEIWKITFTCHVQAFLISSTDFSRNQYLNAKSLDASLEYDAVSNTHIAIAAEYLQLVLYPSFEGEVVTAEKALKRCLRAYERSLREQDTNGSSSSILSNDFASLPSFSRKEREMNRKVFSDLILGTSIMRLRHWYQYRLNCHRRPSQFPILGVEEWMNTDTVDDSDISSIPSKTHNNDDQIESKLQIVTKLIDLHIKYLQNNCADDDDNNNDRNALTEWPQDDDIRRIAVQYSLPTFIVRLWVEQYGVKASEKIAYKANRPGPVTLRRNSICCDSDIKLINRLNEEGYTNAFVPTIQDMHTPSGCIRLDFDGTSSTMNRPRKSLWSLKSWQDGWFEVQDIGSQLIVDAVDVQQSGSDDIVILDYCAGNGGKTLALASRLWDAKKKENSSQYPLEKHKHATDELSGGTIIAHDIVDNRLKQIRGSLIRAGIIRKDDSIVQGDRIPQILTTSDLSSFGVKMADVVLVDAPCSSLGVLRRRPGHRWALTEEDVRVYFPNLQMDVLNKASKFVKNGGSLIYATCSICQDENEHVVEKWESSNTFENEWIRWNFDDTSSHCRAILPHVHNSDGFFIARWKRR